jgi:DNA polymerase-3 subunit beta
MNLEVNKERLNNAVIKAERVTGKNSSLPVLSCIILEAKGGTLKVKSTNLDIALELDVPAKISNEGVVAVTGNILSSYLSSLGKSESVLNLHLQNENLYISSKNSETVVRAILHEDFPEITKNNEPANFKIKPEDLISGLQSVWYSASVSNIKPELSSVYIYPDGEDMFFVATDSFRLAEKSVKIGNTEGFESVLIPYRNTTEIAKIIEDIEGELEVTFAEDQIIFKAPGMYLLSRIVDGVFPDYKQIIPNSESTVVTLLKEDFNQSMKVSNVFSDNFNQATMTVSPADDVFEISTKNKDRGESINKIKVKAEGETLKISFNFKYINDCLSSIKSDSLKFVFNGPGKPLIISGTKDGSFRYLVMPMNK